MADIPGVKSQEEPRYGRRYSCDYPNNLSRQIQSPKTRLLARSAAT